MPAATSNRLLPLLAGAVVLMLVVVGVKSCGGETDAPLVLDAVPRAPAPDADSPADTIKTLTANVAAMTAEVEALRRDNARMREENRQLLLDRTRIEENVTTRIRRDLLSREGARSAGERHDAGVLSSLTARMDALSERLAQGRTPSAQGDIPVGLGLDGVGADLPPDDALIWIAPLDAVTPETGSATAGGLLHRAGQSAGPAWGTVREETHGLAEGLTDKAGLRTSRPIYTVPRNATLIGATAMTALVGRVPIQGQVRDPMPFKVITGADNLAANGLTIPGVAGMVWSGTAIGDWSLSCVTGRLDSVTFVFDDGTIRSLSGDGRNHRLGGDPERPLAWISDEQGVPCVSGERKTNAPAFLAQRIGVMALNAAADAAAAAETTSVVSDNGVATSNVTGDTGAYLLGKTFAGGSDEVGKWLMERQSQSFDAVFVPAGVKLAIHVDHELPIDLDPNGRRLNHANPIDPTHPVRLD